MIGKALIFATGLAVATWGVSVVFKGMGPAPAVVVEKLLSGAEEVSELDGFVRRSDGYNVQIRFVAKGDWIEALKTKGFTETDCETVRQRINFSLMRTAAWPPWRPEALTDVTCFSRFGENEWSPGGRDVILAETGGGWVYFAGEGREYDRALPDSDKVIYEQDERR